MTEERLQRLAQPVADEHYVTTPEDLEKMKRLHQEGELKKMGEMALALFYELQPPGAGEDGLDPMESARLVVAQVKEIFGIGTRTRSGTNANGTPPSSPPPGSPLPAGVPVQKRDPRYPNITAAEWEARVRPRQLLENLLNRLVEACQTQRKAIRKESREGPSPYERAAEIAPIHSNPRVMRGMQDANLREVRRLTNLLLKLKRYEQQKEAIEKRETLHDVLEQKGVSSLAAECPKALSCSNENS